MLPANTNKNTGMCLNGTRFFRQAVFIALIGWVCPSLALGQNLVPNPGFEEADSCWQILGLGEIHDWYSAYLTPDYLLSCLPYGSMNGLPLNILTFQYPYEGEACIGLCTYVRTGDGEEQREWIMAPLTEPLVPGQTYYCSFRANAAFGGNDQYPLVWLASSNVGMLFTTYDRHWYWNDPYQVAPNVAQVDYGEVLTDTMNWTLVGGSFVADSAYSYVMVGNFFSNELTDTVRFADPANVFPWYDISYTLIDAVCVSPDPNGCERAQWIGEAEGGKPYVYPNPAIDAILIGNASGGMTEVLDMLGRRVWSGMVVGNRFSLEVATWSRGAYVLRFRRESGIQTVKFVLTE